MSSLYTRLKITLGKANADEHALAAMDSNDQVKVTDGPVLEFLPLKNARSTGVIFYPGGRCDPRAYAPAAQALAKRGYSVFIPQMPLRLAVLGVNKAAEIRAAHPELASWALGGHSMGGAMAAAYSFKNPGDAQGLFFVASYPANMHAIPDSELPVLMLYGTRDEVTRKTEFEASYTRLPEHAKYVPIEGGDHYRFGSFGNVEVTATIPREEQQRQATSALLDFLQAIEPSD